MWYLRCMMCSYMTIVVICEYREKLMIEEHFCIENLFTFVISGSLSPVVLEVQVPVTVFTFRLQQGRTRTPEKVKCTHGWTE